MNYKEIVAKGIELINLTPHEIKVLDADFSVGPSKDGNILRIQKSSLLQGSVMDCNIFSINEEIYGPVAAFDETKLYIVSQKVAEAMAVDPIYKERRDFIYPINIEHEHTRKPLMDKYGVVVTDSKGEPMTTRQQRIKGCRGFEFPRRLHD